MIISLIVAVAENNVIGKNNQLPWHLPADMKHFRDTTMGHCVIMGRKNYDSIPLKYRPLEGRTNIIVTRQKNFKAEGCIVINSIEEALKEAERAPACSEGRRPLRGVPSGKREIQQRPLEREAAEVFIIGGAEIFRYTLDIADKIYYTRIYNSFQGDVYFPELDLTKWKLISKKDVSADEKNKFPFSFCVYEKIPLLRN